MDYEQSRETTTAAAAAIELTADDDGNVTLNMRGQRFVFPLRFLQQKNKQELLCRLETTPCIKCPNSEYFYDCDAEVFQLLLRYYADPTELHLPSHICGPLLEKEMMMWKLSITAQHLMPCCMHWSMDSKKWRMTLEKFEMGGLQQPPDDSLLDRELHNSFRQSLWPLVDRPASSIPAFLYALTMSVCAVAAAYVFSSEPLHICSDWIEMPGNSCNLNFTAAADAAGMNSTKAANSWKADQRSMIWQFVFTTLFTIDILARMNLSPVKRKFICSPFTWVDVASLVPMYVVLIMRMHHFKLKYDSIVAVGLEILSLSICFRVIRYFRRISGMKVLMYTMRSCFSDLFILFFMILMASCVFGTIFFFVEGKRTGDVPNIFVAIYWALITITTVGYGDISPNTMLGRLTAAACSLSGLLVVAFTVPLLNENFQRFYSHLEVVGDASSREDKAFEQVKGFVKSKIRAICSQNRDNKETGDHSQHGLI